MPRLDDIGKIHGFHVRGDDGLVHTVQRQDPPKGRRDIHNENSEEDPYICLSCPREECTGERACYLMRKKLFEMEERVK